MSVEWHFFLHLTHMIGMTSPYSQKSTSFYIALSTLCFRRKLAAVKRGVRGGELRGGIGGGGVYYLFLFLTHVQLNLRSWLIEDPRMECLGRCRKR